MLASINPLGERARGTRFARTFVWYLAGSIAGGALVGGTLGTLGAGVRSLIDPTSTAIAIAVVMVCVIGIVLDLGITGVQLPSPRRQVNEDWLATYRGWLYGLGFGFELGLGVVTVVATSAVYVMLVLELLSGTLGAGLAIGATFGATRALPLLAVGRVRDPAQLRHALRRADRLAVGVDRISRLSVMVLALTALGVVIAGGGA